MIKKILIANRGEIACRVIRTARKLGYRTVAVYSEADAQAPHVSLADEAVCIGPAAAAQSYLNVGALLAACRKTGANALHPGYGFLSENADFAQACADAGVTFIGPGPEAIRVMGDKAGAKRAMIEAGVPCAPGYLGDKQDDATLIEQAERMGYPLLVKAVSGGGGRGMRLVHEKAELAQAITSARREAQNAFGDGTLMLERLILDGRHIEIQVFADAHGNAVYIGERDCTAQRRRQKVIEESPSPVVSPAMRKRMGRDAVLAAQAIGYRGAGTIEYIVDQDLNHYFLEMNTRLQVEHPVTEMVSGFDLVEWQIRVAEGQPLPVKQEDIPLSGHAIEARLYAEDPYAGFAPQTGPVQWWRPAQALYEGVRIDDGIREGGEVTPHYDPMVAKLIVHGRDRADAIRRLMATLDDAPLLGLKHNARFLRDLVDHPRFRTGSMTTTLIDQWQTDGAPILQAPVASDEAWLIAGALFGARQQGTAHLLRADSVSAWDLPLQQDSVKRTLRVSAASGGLYNVAMNPQAAPVAVKLLSEDATRGEARIELDGVQRRVRAVWLGDSLNLVIEAAVFTFAEVSAWPDAGNALDPSRALAPVAGTVTQVLVQAGDAVTEGQPLLAIEAMKMEMWLNAQAPGVIKAVYAKAGDQVQAKALLIDIELNKED
ncbi:acetyl-CoA carboxylase biotin carboxylase subunit [Aquabacterium parvum]|uniref:acetyl-CoA carboxylase biotin carboxylase subunit n=1 Tax=Aquabacterium parvum TaxID=70584 RepID=UPI000718D579|nr:acetyl/propionyl/methylcrotonyl-CoA carboxylase subunit alpha [Aquabacterium parvum]MBU0916410.1 acetyl/propionyl/methylcrotonyl-CoA carboxylase subunit alpha [Gammaproteobacteria bacterium]